MERGWDRDAGRESRVNELYDWSGRNLATELYFAEFHIRMTQPIAEAISQATHVPAHMRNSRQLHDINAYELQLAILSLFPSPLWSRASLH